MIHDTTETTARPRVLLFSQRNIYEREVWRCSFREFEAILPAIDAVDVVAPAAGPWHRQAKRVALRLGELAPVPLTPAIRTTRIERDYDLFFAVIEKPSELLHLAAARDWQERCRASVCWLTEFYVKDIPTFKSAMTVLSQFDHVLFMFAANEPFRPMIRGTGRYLAAGIDALRFCPSSPPAPRPIDVLSIGRRSPQTHRALLRLAREENLFYVHDTIDSLVGFDLEEHRGLMADLARRSRYFLVNPGKVNAPEETGGQREFGYRYFEGAAPGTIMIGERPGNREFDRLFHWDDAVIDLPFGSDQIGALIKDFDAQPERQRAIRKENIVQSLLHHDWVYRWETVLNVAGLPPLPGLSKRKERLKERAAMVAVDYGQRGAE